MAKCWLFQCIEGHEIITSWWQFLLLFQESLQEEKFQALCATIVGLGDEDHILTVVSSKCSSVAMNT